MRSLTLLAAAIVLLHAPALAQDRQAIRPEGTGTRGPYTPAIRIGNVVYASGQLGIAPGGRGLVPGGIREETRQTMENIDRVLRAAGTSLQRAVKCTVFLADIADFGAMNEVYVTFFQGVDPPARSTVAVAGLVLSARVEIECIAAV